MFNFYKKRKFIYDGKNYYNVDNINIVEIDINRVKIYYSNGSNASFEISGNSSVQRDLVKKLIEAIKDL